MQLAQEQVDRQAVHAIDRQHVAAAGQRLLGSPMGSSPNLAGRGDALAAEWRDRVSGGRERSLFVLLARGCRSVPLVVRDHTRHGPPWRERRFLLRRDTHGVGKTDHIRGSVGRCPCAEGRREHDPLRAEGGLVAFRDRDHPVAGNAGAVQAARGHWRSRPALAGEWSHGEKRHERREEWHREHSTTMQSRSRPWRLAPRRAVRARARPRFQATRSPPLRTTTSRPKTLRSHTPAHPRRKRPTPTATALPTDPLPPSPRWPAPAAPRPQTASSPPPPPR